MITKEEIQLKVKTDPKWATRAIVVLFARQTAVEQSAEMTSELNGRGFNGTDAGILSSFAKQIERGRTLSPKQLAIAYKKLPKYWRQLLEEAERKAVQAAPAPIEIAVQVEAQCPADPMYETSDETVLVAEQLNNGYILHEFISVDEATEWLTGPRRPIISRIRRPSQAHGKKLHEIFH